MNTSENKARILVVEDEADIQQVLCVFLQYAGFETLGVSDGRAAIRSIPEFNPQLIVLDLMMQPVDGYKVLDWLRENRLMPPPPVLVLTALTHITKQVQGYEEGAIEYLTKPTQPSVLVERIRAILSLTDEQRSLWRSKRMDKQRKVVERLYAPQADEFVF